MTDWFALCVGFVVHAGTLATVAVRPLTVTFVHEPPGVHTCPLPLFHCERLSVAGSKAQLLTHRLPMVTGAVLQLKTRIA